LLYTLAFIFHLASARIDGTPFALALTGLVCSVALFKFGVIEIVPAARELAIDSLDDGFLASCLARISASRAPRPNAHGRGWPKPLSSGKAGPYP
jgi:hypothetical protein